MQPNYPGASSYQSARDPFISHSFMQPQAGFTEKKFIMIMSELRDSKLL